MDLPQKRNKKYKVGNSKKGIPVRIIDQCIRQFGKEVLPQSALLLRLLLKQKYAPTVMLTTCSDLC